MKETHLPEQSAANGALVEANTERLEIEHRNQVQAVVFSKILDQSAPLTEVMEQVKKLGEMISNILDNPDQVEIRELARLGRYEEAGEQVISQLKVDGHLFASV